MIQLIIWVYKEENSSTDLQRSARSRLNSNHKTINNLWLQSSKFFIRCLKMHFTNILFILLLWVFTYYIFKAKEVKETDFFTNRNVYAVIGDNHAWCYCQSNAPGNNKVIQDGATRAICAKYPGWCKTCKLSQICTIL